ncbi:MAG: hypothetical protein ABI417_11435 [Coleofasciculaceae cyanobacterium]
MNIFSGEQLFITEAAKALLETPINSLFLNLSRYQLWQVKGIDSLQLVRRLVSNVVTKIALFQSIDFIFTGSQYSVLRLGDGDFCLESWGLMGA